MIFHHCFQCGEFALSASLPQSGIMVSCIHVSNFYFAKVSAFYVTGNLEQLTLGKECATSWTSRQPIWGHTKTNIHFAFTSMSDLKSSIHLACMFFFGGVRGNMGGMNPTQAPRQHAKSTQEIQNQILWSRLWGRHANIKITGLPSCRQQTLCPHVLCRYVNSTATVKMHSFFFFYILLYSHILHMYLRSRSNG